MTTNSFAFSKQLLASYRRKFIYAGLFMFIAYAIILGFQLFRELDDLSSIIFYAFLIAVLPSVILYQSFLQLTGVKKNKLLVLQDDKIQFQPGTSRTPVGEIPYADIQRIRVLKNKNDKVLSIKILTADGDLNLTSFENMNLLVEELARKVDAYRISEKKTSFTIDNTPALISFALLIPITLYSLIKLQAYFDVLRQNTAYKNIGAIGWGIFLLVFSLLALVRTPASLKKLKEEPTQKAKNDAIFNIATALLFCLTGIAIVAAAIVGYSKINNLSVGLLLLYGGICNFFAEPSFNLFALSSQTSHMKKNKYWWYYKLVSIFLIVMGIANLRKLF